MALQDTIIAKLNVALNPSEINVINESHLHAGHQPQFDGEGETHFRIQMVSDAFSGLTRVARHRKINELLLEHFDQTLHALALELSAPGETKRW